MNNNNETKKGHDLELIHILHDEWKFRLSQYWAITSKTVLLSFILFFIPYMKDTWGVNIINLPNYTFPIVGIFFSIATCCLSSIEMYKINHIKKSIKQYIATYAQHIDNPYTYNHSIHHNLPLCICIVQILIGIFVLITVI